LREVLHFADQFLNRLLSAYLDTTLERPQMPHCVARGVFRDQSRKKLEAGLIRIRLQVLKDLCPMRLEGIGTATGAWFDVIPTGESTYYHSACPRILTPAHDTIGEGAQLSAMETAEVLRAQLIEELALVE
jgi:hypothetical protein